MHGRHPRCIGDTRGAQLVEHTLLIGLLSLLVVGGTALGDRVRARAEAQAACLASLACAGGSAAPAGGGFDGKEPGEDPAPLLLASAGRGGEPAAPAVPGPRSALAAPPPAAPSPPAAPRTLWQRGADVGRGFFVDGAWGAVAGLWEAATHPVQTAQGIAHAASHPVQTFRAVRESLAQAWEENPERLAGAALFEVITAAIAPLKAARAARTAAGVVAPAPPVAVAAARTAPRAAVAATMPADAAELARRARAFSRVGLDAECLDDFLREYLHHRGRRLFDADDMDRQLMPHGFGLGDEALYPSFGHQLERVNEILAATVRERLVPVDRVFDGLDNVREFVRTGGHPPGTRGLLIGHDPAGGTGHASYFTVGANGRVDFFQLGPTPYPEYRLVLPEALR